MLRRPLLRSHTEKRLSQDASQKCALDSGLAVEAVACDRLFLLQQNMWGRTLQAKTINNTAEHFRRPADEVSKHTDEARVKMDERDGVHPVQDAPICRGIASSDVLHGLRFTGRKPHPPVNHRALVLFPVKHELVNDSKTLQKHGSTGN